MIISDNPDYLPRVMKLPKGADSCVIGKVIWWGHTARE
jgi:phage repressor protein C with HTH and peptisase S24 domain